MFCIEETRGRIQIKKTIVYIGPAVVDYNLTLCRLHESTSATLWQNRIYPSVRDFGFGLSAPMPYTAW